MSRNWTPEELQRASQAMKAAGHLSYEEFCAELERIGRNASVGPSVPHRTTSVESIKFTYPVKTRLTEQNAGRL